MSGAALLVACGGKKTKTLPAGTNVAKVEIGDGAARVQIFAAGKNTNPIATC